MHIWTLGALFRSNVIYAIFILCVCVTIWIHWRYESKQNECEEENERRRQKGFDKINESSVCLCVFESTKLNDPLASIHSRQFTLLLICLFRNHISMQLLKVSKVGLTMCIVCLCSRVSPIIQLAAKRNKLYMPLASKGTELIFQNNLLFFRIP